MSGSPDAGGDARGVSASSGGSGGGGGNGGGSGGDVVPCPPDPPTVGVSCATAGQGCAYMIGGQCEGYRCHSADGWQMDPTVTCP